MVKAVKLCRSYERQAELEAKARAEGLPSQQPTPCRWSTERLEAIERDELVDDELCDVHEAEFFEAAGKPAPDWREDADEN